MELKLCRQCKKNNAQTYVKDGIVKQISYCASCNREKFSKGVNERKWAETSRLKNKYKITREELSVLYDAQNNSCKICGKKELGEKLAIDHCHKTGKVRGLLCRNCNIAIGLFKDDLVALENAIKYLKE